MTTNSVKPTSQIGDILYRVDGEWIDDGSEVYCGMELSWTEWRVVKPTPCGAWLECVERPWKKKRFALIPGARWVSQSKKSALQGLVARKRRHIAILNHQTTTASDTLLLAEAELAKATSK